MWTVVLLTTPPGFRAEHYEKTVKAGKHAFVEKPIAVDAPNYRRFLDAVKIAKEKGLGLQSGFCWRSHYLEREVYKRILGGELGNVQAAHGTYLGGTPWTKPRQEGWTDLEYHLRNWMHMTWLSGDHLVEQAIHTVDKMCWTFGDADPVSAKAWAAGSSVWKKSTATNGITSPSSTITVKSAAASSCAASRPVAGAMCRTTSMAPKGTLRKKSGTMAAIKFADGNTGNTTARRTTCIRPSTTNSSPRSVPASRSTS